MRTQSCCSSASKGGGESVAQEQTQALMIERARAGREVVRLKGGDPFVFGRGGEEALALREAGIEFSVVPGVTAGVAAAAYAGIPVTHRGLSTGVALVTGHTREDAPRDAGGTPDESELAGPDGSGEQSAELDWEGSGGLPRDARLLHGRAPAAAHRRAADRRRTCSLPGSGTRGTRHVARPAHSERHARHDRRGRRARAGESARDHDRGGRRRACRELALAAGATAGRAHRGCDPCARAGQWTGAAPGRARRERDRGAEHPYAHARLVPLWTPHPTT